MSAALRCDACGTFATTERPPGPYRFGEGPLPAGWLRVFVFDRAREDGAASAAVETHEVCSRACAAECLKRETLP